MRIIIAGSRTFNDYTTLCEVCNYMLRNQKQIEIIGGEANGADKLGKMYANEHGYTYHSFPADWNTYGKSAGYKRNLEMGEFADALIAFWDGESKGTKHMIDIAKKLGLKIKIHKFK